MCFSEEVSLSTFFIGTIFGYLAYTIGRPMDKITGFYLFYVSLMQGIEYLLWRNQKCDLLNINITRLGVLLNNTQPFALAFAIYAFNKNLSKNSLYFILGALLCYSCALIPYLYHVYESNICTLKGTKDDHLNWKWINMKYTGLNYKFYFLSVTISFLFGLPKYNYFCIFLLYFTYYTSKIFYPNSTGSLWCFYTAFMPLVYYLFNADLKLMK